jgi:hypothetical protein
MTGLPHRAHIEKNAHPAAQAPFAALMRLAPRPTMLVLARIPDTGPQPTRQAIAGEAASVQRIMNDRR